MPSDPKSLMSPPSPVFPLAGALAGYFISGKSVWGAATGLFAGALLNLSSKVVSMRAEAAKEKNLQAFEGNIGGEAIAALTGSRDAVEANKAVAGTSPSLKT